MIWKDVVGFEGLYQISDCGQLKTFNWKNTGQTRIMKPATNKKGYLMTVLVKNKKNKSVILHRLVAQAFIPNPENKPTINHKNCIKTDNRVENLEWNTHKENTAHAIQNGLFVFMTPEALANIPPRRGELNGNSLLTVDDVLEIRRSFKKRIVTREILAAKYGVSACTIKDVVTRKSWKHI